MNLIQINVVILKPLPPDPNREHYYYDGQSALSQKLEEVFEYYSKTKELEVGTERTEILQGVVDKMTVGTGIKTSTPSS